MELGAELRSVLSDVLQREGLLLEHHEVTEECRPGDDYLGQVLRVKTTFSHAEPRHFIFKCPPPRKKCLKEDEKRFNFFHNEAAFYSKIVPIFEQFKSQFKSTLPFAIPRSYHIADDTNNEIIILEDLLTLGFRMPIRTQFLDLDHCLLVMQELGRFHAISIAMKILQPDKFNEVKNIVKETVFCEEEKKFAKTEKACENALHMLKKKYPNADYAEQLNKLTTNFFDNMADLVSRESPLCVINHGNCWTNNLMFQYDDLQARPMYLRWFDFQLTRYSSAACDLSYFLYTCTTQAMRCEQWEELLTAYLAELNETLAIMHLPLAQVSRGQLDIEMNEFAAFGVGMALLVMPPITVNSSELNVVSEIENELCAIHITDVVVDAVKRGFFDQ